MLDLNYRCGSEESYVSFDSFINLDGCNAADTKVIKKDGSLCTLTERNYHDFTYARQHMVVTKPFEVDICHRATHPYFILTALTQGCLAKRGILDLDCSVGDAQLSLDTGYTSKWSVDKVGRVTQEMIILPFSFIERMEERYPEVFGKMATAMRSGNMDERNVISKRLDGKTLRFLSDIGHSEVLGNAATDFVEHKMLHILSPSLYSFVGLEAANLATIPMRDKMHDAKQIVEERLATPPSIAELASMVGTNECTLKSAFRKEFGETVFGLIFRLRMEKAAKLIMRGDLPMTDIALSLGYDYPSHFTSAFRRFYGQSPTEFRMSHVRG